MTPAQQVLVRVQGAWNGWQTAEVRLADLEQVHWLKPDRAPQPLVHGYVSCANLVSGEIPHGCQGTSAPHRVLVCAIKHHNIASVYAEVVRRASDTQALTQSGVAGMSSPSVKAEDEAAVASRGRTLMGRLFNWKSAPRAEIRSAVAGER